MIMHHSTLIYVHEPAIFVQPSSTLHILAKLSSQASHIGIKSRDIARESENFHSIKVDQAILTGLQLIEIWQ
jgi:hypothetical protein